MGEVTAEEQISMGLGRTLPRAAALMVENCALLVTGRDDREDATLLPTLATADLDDGKDGTKLNAGTPRNGANRQTP